MVLYLERERGDHARSTGAGGGVDVGFFREHDIDVFSRWEV